MVHVAHRSVRTRARAAHTGERGTTMFIVLMVLMLVSAIGLFAMSNSRFEEQTAGFERQRMTAFQVASMAAYDVANELTAQPSWYIGLLAASGNGATSSNYCTANAGALGACVVLDTYVLEARLGTSNIIGGHLIQLPTIVSGVATVPGSLGLSTMTGGFQVQLTEMFQNSRPVAKFNVKTGTFSDVTMTSTGVLWQDTTPNGVLDTTETWTRTTASGRGRITIGPTFQ